MHLNLLPSSYRRRQIVLKRVRQWSMVWGVALVLALVFGWFCAADCRKLSSDLDLLEAKYSRVKNTQQELRVARKELQELEQREALVLELSQRRPMLSLLGILSKAAQQCDGTVSVRHIAWETDSSNSAGAAAGELEPRLTLRGVGLNNLWVAQFASALRRNDVLREVQLKSTEQQIVNDKVAHGYQLECIVY